MMVENHSSKFSFKCNVNPFSTCNSSCLHGSYDGLSLMTFMSLACLRETLCSSLYGRIGLKLVGSLGLLTLFDLDEDAYL